jgi:hypothetical protein
LNYVDEKLKIINHYGKEHQLTKCIEEMAELTHVISRRIVDKEWDCEALTEELADVYLVLDELKLIYLSDFLKNPEEFTNELDSVLKVNEEFKLLRVRERMKKNDVLL